MLFYWCLLSEGGESSIASAKVTVRNEHEKPNLKVQGVIFTFIFKKNVYLEINVFLFEGS